MKPDAPPTDAGSLMTRLDSYIDRVDLDALFGRKAPLEVEVGTGDGGFLLTRAGQHPERNFIGIERLLGRMRKLDRKGRRAGFTHLRLLRLEAGYVLKYLLPAASVVVLHIYFPDPWPKKRQRKNRLIQVPFGSVVADVLEPGGCVFVRTDDLDYFEQMCEVFDGLATLRRVETPLELAELKTEFERDFERRGIQGLKAGWRKDP